MLDSLHIEGFRCFERFEVKDLARVNLLVGTNNCGKTSLLEALELWAGRAAPDVLEAVLQRRDEHSAALPHDLGLPVRHLFHGHTLEPDQAFDISASRKGATHCIQASIHVSDGWSYETPQGRGHLLPDLPAADTALNEGPLVLQIAILGSPDGTTDSSNAYGVRLSTEGHLPVRTLRRMLRAKDREPVLFIPTRSLSRGAAAAMFGDIVLTDEEPRIIDALRTIDPSIERLALASSDAHPTAGSGLFVRCVGQPQRIPIGSMGDGIWRMLTLAMALVKTRGGVLLIDEIDTGLHFSVMMEMWKLVLETARRLDVQVFATTHSRDCYESLAAVLRDSDAAPGTAAIHRIERDKGRTIVYDQRQIIIAAEDDIEVR